MLLNAGASFHLNDTPASQPNASQITKAVVSGRTHAARNDAATKPMANRAWRTAPRKEQAPAPHRRRVDGDARGEQDGAGGHDDEPRHQACGDGAGHRVDALREQDSFTVRPFSTTLDCVKNIIHGAMVVPTIAMTGR